MAVPTCLTADLLSTSAAWPSRKSPLPPNSLVLSDGMQMLRPTSSSRPPSRARGCTPLSRQSSRSLGSPGPLGPSSPGNALVPSRPCSGRARTPGDSRHSIDGASTPIAMALSREPAGRLLNLRTGGFQSPSGSGTLPAISSPQSPGNTLSGTSHHLNLSHQLNTGTPSNPTRRSSNSGGFAPPPPPPHHPNQQSPSHRPMGQHAPPRSRAQQPSPPMLPFLVSNEER